MFLPISCRDADGLLVNRALVRKLKLHKKIARFYYCVVFPLYGRYTGCKPGEFVFRQPSYGLMDVPVDIFIIISSDEIGFFSSKCQIKCRFTRRIGRRNGSVHDLSVMVQIKRWLESIFWWILVGVLRSESAGKSGGSLYELIMFGKKHGSLETWLVEYGYATKLPKVVKSSFFYVPSDDEDDERS